MDKYLITSAQVGASVHKKFYTNLEKYAKKLQAKILVIPLKGWSDEDELDDTILNSTFTEVVSGDMALNRHLIISDFFITPTKRNPLAGLGSIVQAHNSTIVGSPKQFMLPEANSLKGLPKILMSTGACTQEYYPKMSTPHKIAEAEHTIGALYVEVLAERFQFRQLNATTDGNFIDFGRNISNDQIVRAKAIILGDLHTGETDPVVLAKSLELIRTMRPKYLVVHDLFDGASVNHHEEHNHVSRAKKYAKGDLASELKDCGQMLDTLLKAGPKDMEIIVVKSNHDQFLDRWLNPGKYATDERNLRIACFCTLKQLDGKDPLEEGIREMYGLDKRVKFLKRTDDFKVLGWQLGAHGDLGANGSKNASCAQISKHTGKSITGHRHTPGIYKNAIVVGTSTRLDLDYTQGSPSSWMHTHAILYPNGKAQLVNVIDGDFHL